MTRRTASMFVLTVGVGCITAAAGCSYREQFFVINSSARSLAITATATVYKNVNTGEPICSWVWEDKPLRVVAAASVGRAYVPYQAMTTEPGTVFDAASCSVRVSVGPGSAVLLWETANGRRSEFLTKIVFADAGREVGYTDDLPNRFEKRSSAVYVLEYRPSQVANPVGPVVLPMSPE